MATAAPPSAASISSLSQSANNLACTHSFYPSVATVSTSSNSDTDSEPTFAEYDNSAFRSNSVATATFSTASISTSMPSNSLSCILPPAPLRIGRLQSVLKSTPTFIDSVTDLRQLAEGTSGVVYTGHYKQLAVVVKLPKAASISGAAWREWQCHIRLPPHPHLVHFLGALPMLSANYLVTELVARGSLIDLLHSAAAADRCWWSRPYAVMCCARALSAALLHIHSHGFVHRDVSARNVLVDTDGRMVLADLGLATQLSPDGSGVSDDGGEQAAVPVRWTSPEALARQRYSSKSDVWSLGVTLWECVSGGRLPYDHHHSTQQAIAAIVLQRSQLEVDDSWGNEEAASSEAERSLADKVRALISLCLTHDVEQRPDSRQLTDAVEAMWEEWRTEAGRAAVEVLEERMRAGG